MFAVGDVVMCVKDNWNIFQIFEACPQPCVPKKGKIYTIRNIFTRENQTALQFTEIKCKQLDDGESGWNAINFRKVIDNREAMKKAAGVSVPKEVSFL